MGRAGRGKRSTTAVRVSRPFAAGKCCCFPTDVRVRLRGRLAETDEQEELSGQSLRCLKIGVRCGQTAGPANFGRGGVGGLRTSLVSAEWFGCSSFRHAPMPAPAWLPCSPVRALRRGHCSWLESRDYVGVPVSFLSAASGLSAAVSHKRDVQSGVFVTRFTSPLGGGKVPRRDSLSRQAVFLGQRAGKGLPFFGGC